MEINVFEKQDILRMFPDMVGTDDHLIFEYFYTAELKKDFVWPVFKVYDIPNIPRRNVKATACPSDCACGG